MNDQELDLFETMETAIVHALADLDVPDDADLITLLSVFAKLSSDAAISYGISEDDFANTMRRTYKTMYEYKTQLEN